MLRCRRPSLRLPPLLSPPAPTPRHAAETKHIGKVEELGTSRRLSYTTRGQLVGHVALGLEILERHVARLEGFPVEIKSMLQHFIVSHHGEIDKGAVRRPASPEAILLHYLDEVDARLEQAWRLIDQGPAGEEWTAYAPSLERQLYRWCPLAEEELDA